MKIRANVSVFYITLIGNQIAYANSSVEVSKCKPVEQKIEEITRMKSYSSSAVDEIFKISTEYDKCRDGSFADGFTDIVVKSLNADLTKTIEYASKNALFEVFILKNINSSADNKDLENLTKMAKSECPPNNRFLCKKIEKASINALKESKSFQGK